MGKHISLFLTASLFLMSLSVFASPSSNNDDDDPAPPAYASAPAVQSALSQNLDVDSEKENLLKSLGEQTGDLELFMKDQLRTFERLSIQDLSEAIASSYYEGTLSPNTKHGETYRGIAPGSVDNNGDLKLFGKNLRLVPLNFPGVEGIKNLLLNHNELRVPPDVSALPKLEELVLFHNQLTEPPVVTGLPALKELYLNNNQLKVAPDLSRLASLNFLDLSHNQLTMPPILSGLEALQFLYLENNQLTEPPVVAGLPKLTWLHLHNNQLTEPPVVTGLTALMILSLHNNQLTKPLVVAGLTALTWLYLDPSLCGDTTLLDTLRELNKGRDPWNEITLIAVSRDEHGTYVETRVTLD